MYRIEFWDFGKWNEKANERFAYKAQAIERANELNRITDHETRQGAFEGHRYRVRKVTGEVILV